LGGKNVVSSDNVVTLDDDDDDRTAMSEVRVLFLFESSRETDSILTG